MTEEIFKSDKKILRGQKRYSGVAKEIFRGDIRDIQR